MNDLVELGKIVGTHGVRGELRAEDWAEPGLWTGLKSIFVGGAPMEILSARPHKSFMLLKLKDVDTMDGAMVLKGRLITVPREQIKLEDGRYLYRDLYGFSVFDLRTQTEIGTLSEVRESPASMLYVVSKNGREILIPAVPAFDRGVDFEARILRVETIEGMDE